MKIYLQILAAVFLLTSQPVTGEDTFNLESPNNKGLLRLEVDNDIIWSKDSNFTNGWSIQYHTVAYGSWDDAEAPTVSKWIGNHFPSLDDKDSIVRFGHGVGQLMFTPDDISIPEPPEGELPYAGTLTYTTNWQSFNTKTARTFQVTAGIMGEESFAADIQEFLHNDLDWGDDAAGWDTQRDTEPIINLAYQYTQNIVERGCYANDWAAQLYTGTTFMLGNLMTSAEIGLGVRFGWNMKEGFNSFQAPPGVGVYKAAQIPKPEGVSPHGFDLIAGLRGMGLLYSVIYDGSFITDDDRDVDREDFVVSALLGLNYHYYDRFSIRLSAIKSSDLLIQESLPPPRPGKNKTTADNSFGSLMIDFHF